MNNQYDIAVIGAGISGTAAAYKLLQQKPDLNILLLEQSDGHRLGQTGHNSGVLHSPLNYIPGSAKAKNCASGREELLEFCNERGVAVEICGKVLVATNRTEREQLTVKKDQAVENGISDARLIERDELLEREPHVTNAEQGLLIPSTGIIDFGAVAEELGKAAVEKNARLEFNAQVLGIRRESSGWHISSTRGDFSCKTLVNCAGVQSDRITRMAGLVPKGRIVPVMGIYYRIIGEAKKLVSHIVYPLPHPRIPVLGVHVHRTISGDVFAGPNAVICFSRNNYKYPSFNSSDIWDMASNPGFWKFLFKNWKTGIEETLRTISKPRFTREVQKLIPEVSARDLEPAIPGIRAQLVLANGEAADDFVFTEGKDIICCESVASPGATACLANGGLLAKMVLDSAQS